MKNIHVKIDRKNVFEQVAESARYSSGLSGETFDRVETLATDTSLLNRLFSEMSGVLTDKLKQLITSSSINDDSLELDLEVSGAYDETLTESIVSDLKGAMAAGVTSRWFRFTLPAKAEEWENESNRMLMAGYGKLYHRIKPKKK